MTLDLPMHSYLQYQKHMKQKKNEINQTLSKLKTFAHQKTLSGKWKFYRMGKTISKSHMNSISRIYLQITYWVQSQNILRTPTAQQQKDNPIFFSLFLLYCPSSQTPLLLPFPSHPSGLSPCTGFDCLLHALNLDWWSISHMVIYMFQCYSLKSVFDLRDNPIFKMGKGFK